MTKFKTMLVSFSLVLGGVAGVAAAEGRPDRQALKQKYDADGNGTLDTNERANLKKAMVAMRTVKRQAAITKYDANRNGVLDPAEKQTMRDGRIAERFAKLDANGDGLISLAEFKAGKHAHHGKRGGKRGHRGGAPGGAGGNL